MLSATLDDLPEEDELGAATLDVDELDEEASEVDWSEEVDVMEVDVTATEVLEEGFSSGSPYASVVVFVVVVDSVVLVHVVHVADCC